MLDQMGGMINAAWAEGGKRILAKGGPLKPNLPSQLALTQCHMSSMGLLQESHFCMIHERNTAY